MVSIIKQSGKETAYVTEFLVDTVSEILTLPVYPAISVGSVAIVLEGSLVYMLGNDNTWHEF